MVAVPRAGVRNERCRCDLADECVDAVCVRKPRHFDLLAAELLVPKEQASSRSNETHNSVARPACCLAPCTGALAAQLVGWVVRVRRLLQVNERRCGGAPRSTELRAGPAAHEVVALISSFRSFPPGRGPRGPSNHAGIGVFWASGDMLRIGHSWCSSTACTRGRQYVVMELARELS